MWFCDNCVVLVDLSKKPFYQEFWFLIIVALLGLIIIIIVMSLLCLTGKLRRSKYTGKFTGTSPVITCVPSQPFSAATTLYMNRRIYINVCCFAVETLI